MFTRESSGSGNVAFSVVKFNSGRQQLPGCLYYFPDLGDLHSNIIHHMFLPVRLDKQEGVGLTQCHFIVICQAEKLLILDRLPQPGQFSRAATKRSILHHLVVIECNNTIKVILDHAACIVILICPLTGCIDLYVDILRTSRVGAANIQ